MSNRAVEEWARALTANVAPEWIGYRELLERIAGLETSPWQVVCELGAEGLERKVDAAAIRAAYEGLQRYLTEPTWFEREGYKSVAVSRDRPIAYFCAEFGVTPWLPIYSGGLGILAGDVLKTASDLGVPMVGLGLLYRRGYFSQIIDEHGHQRETYPEIDPADLPLAPITDSNGNPLRVPIPIGDRTAFAGVWRLDVGRTPLFLLDTDVPENADPADRAITRGLYAGDQDLRIRQEIVLGVGGVRVLRAMGYDPAIFSMNEGHAGLLGIELVTSVLGVGFEEAVRWTRERVVYTNHTVVPAGNDVFPDSLVASYLGHYAASTGLGVDRLLALGGGELGKFSMTDLAFALAGKANAVSSLHREVVEREWPGHVVEAVTNGVHIPTWVGPAMARVFDRHVPEWRTPAADWSQLADATDAELWAARNTQRAALVSFVNQVQGRVRLDENRMTLVWARRFAEYKRAGLLATDLERLAALMSDAERPIQLVIAGKAHPRDEGGKGVLRDLFARLESDPRIAGRVAFVPNYDIATARILAAGADIWVNTPRKPLEASGTSGMKSSDNGGLQLTVRDGWAAEVDWWDVGWGIHGQDDARDAAELYGYLEDDAIPAFYGRTDGIPTRWIAMMRRSMAITLAHYGARRMLLEYVDRLYEPLLKVQATNREAA